MPTPDIKPDDTEEVSNVAVPEQPPMIDDEDEDAVDVSTEDLSVQGGE